MRILLTTHAFYPDSVGGGGVARYAASLARTLLERGHQVSLLTTRSGSATETPGARYEDDRQGELPVRRLTFNLGLAPNAYRYEWDNPWVNERILEYAELQRADVVHYVHGGHLSMSSVPLLKARGHVLLASVLDYWFVCARSNLRRADGSLCDGPDGLAAECIRCLITRPWTQQDRAAELVRHAPNLALKALALASRTLREPPGRWSWIEAQTQRLTDMRGYLSDLHAVLCPSEFVADLLRRNGFGSANLHVLPLGIEMPAR